MPGQRGSDGAFPCPALCQRPWDVSQSSAMAPVPVQGGKLAVSRCLLGRSSGVGVSEGRALQGSALRLQPLLNLHLDILCFQQKETFTLLQCSTPVTFIFCTSWLKQKISDGRGCAVFEWALLGLILFLLRFLISRQNSLQAVLPSSPCPTQPGCVLWQSFHSVLTAAFPVLWRAQVCWQVSPAVPPSGHTAASVCGVAGTSHPMQPWWDPPLPHRVADT